MYIHAVGSIVLIVSLLFSFSSFETARLLLFPHCGFLDPLIIIIRAMVEIWGLHLPLKKMLF